MKGTKKDTQKSAKMVKNRKKVLSLCVCTVLVFSLLSAAVATVEGSGVDSQRLSQATECGIKSVGFYDKLDNDNDGYFSEFSADVVLDTDCSEKYDDFPDPPIEPFLVLYLNGERRGYIKVSDVVEEDNLGEVHQNYLSLDLTLWNSLLEEQEIPRGNVDITIVLVDNDYGMPISTADELDRWHGSMQWEPHSDDLGDGGGETPDGNEEDTSEGKYTLEYTASQHGSIQVGIGLGWVSEGTETKQFSAGRTVEVTAKPDSGYEFSHWSGDVPSSQKQNRTIAIKMDTNKQITANFEAAGAAESTKTEVSRDTTHTLTFTTTGRGTIMDENGADLFEVNRGNRLQYQHGDNETLVAVAEEGYTFKNWSGDVPDAQRTSRKITLTMTQDREITANFVPKANATTTQNQSQQTPTPSQNVSQSSVQLTATATTLDKQTVAISYTIATTNQTPLTHVALTTQGVPNNWTVVKHTDANGSWMPDDHGWYWSEISPNTVQTTTIVFRTTNNTSIENYSFTGMVEAAEIQNQSVTINMTDS